MEPHDYQQWELLVGALVEIRHNGSPVRIGTVEAAMPDGTALWVAADGAHLRQLFEKTQGFTVYVEPQQLLGTAAYRMTKDQLYPKIGVPPAG